MTDWPNDMQKIGVTNPEIRYLRLDGNQRDVLWFQEDSYSDEDSGTEEVSDAEDWWWRRKYYYRDIIIIYTPAHLHISKTLA